LNPYLHVATSAMKQMKGLLTEFGMTPSARSRLHVPDRLDADDDTLTAFRQAHPSRPA
jgi:P27 family predicted phage terminase small subunit